jgi:hypothetical protein
VPVVPLNRRFFECNEKEPTHPEVRPAMGLEEGGIGWDELLTKGRVVILAEARSGKSMQTAPGPLPHCFDGFPTVWRLLSRELSRRPSGITQNRPMRVT